MTWLIGSTGYSLLDVWTIVHLCFWIFIGSVLWAASKPLNKSFEELALVRAEGYTACALAALVWEVFERLFEKKWPELWLNPESWWNSYASDIGTALLGLKLVWMLLDYSLRRNK